MEEVPQCEHFFEGKDRKTGQVKWTATSVDLDKSVFGGGVGHDYLR